MELVAIAVMGAAIAFFAWVLCHAADEDKDFDYFDDEDEE